VVVTAALAGCRAGTPGGAAGGAGDAGRLSADGVTVVLRWRGSGPALRLEATYTPDEPGFHLYGTELPALGVDGVGRPTRLEVGGSASATGLPVLDRPARLEPVAGASRPVPVYPPGPVTLSLPTRLAPAGVPRVWVSYAACSARACMPPVTHHPVDVVPPA
jgi:hypothetical protein